MGKTKDFATWAMNPKLNQEEAYCAELLVEHGLQQWESKHPESPKTPTNWEARSAAHKRRMLNPAHRAKLKRADVERAAEMLPESKSLDLSCHSDRPVRDVSGVRFLPELESLHLWATEVADLSPVQDLAQLNELVISDNEVEDLRCLARLPKLKKVWLTIQQPWPLVEGLEKLAELEEFHWRGNLLLLETIPCLPAVAEAHFEHCGFHSLPLRDATRLPAMPRLEKFILNAVVRLDGIGRWPRLISLDVSGRMRDLAPLQELKRLTHLTLRTKEIRDPSPLVGLPELRRLLIASEHPADFSCLAEAPRLHEVEIQGCDINKLEIATLNSVLTPWSDEFGVNEPRPLAPLHFYSTDGHEMHQTISRMEGPWELTPEEKADPGMAASEDRWVHRRIEAAIRRLFGKMRWGNSHSHGSSSRHGWVTLEALEAAERLPELLEAIRGIFATTRKPWCVTIMVSLSNSKPEEETEEDDLQREIEDSRDYRERQRERQEYLERLHRMRLQEQEGKEIKAEDFASPEKAAPKPQPDPGLENVVNLFSTEDASAEEEDEGDDDWEEAEEHPLAEKYNLFAILTEHSLWVNHRDIEAAELMMKRPPEPR